MELYPTALQRDDEQRQLVIQWSDGRSLRYGYKQLRDACPCATCREKRQAPEQPANPLRVLTPAELEPLSIAAMKPVGNYAYSIDFSDGHNTGIYTFEHLLAIADSSGS